MLPFFCFLQIHINNHNLVFGITDQNLSDSSSSSRHCYLLAIVCLPFFRKFLRLSEHKGGVITRKLSSQAWFSEPVLLAASCGNRLTCTHICSGMLQRNGAHVSLSVRLPAPEHLGTLESYEFTSRMAILGTEETILKHICQSGRGRPERPAEMATLIYICG